MTPRLALAALLCALAARAAAPVPVPEPDPEPPGAGKFYKSPQAVFDASQAASKKKDYKTAIDCIAPEARGEMAGQLAVMVVMLKGVGLPGIDDSMKDMKAVLDKHGLTEKATAGVNTADMPAAAKALGKLIKKPEAFAAEMMAAMEKLHDVIKGVGVGLPTYSLKDVKITGAKARGVMEMSVAGSTSAVPIEFVKGRNGWRMLMPRMGEPAPVVPVEKK